MANITNFLSRKEHKSPVVSQPTVEDITEYVKASTIPVEDGRKCVDGRYRPDQATGMIARPGGDGGYVMALMAVNKKKKLGLTPEQCFNEVYNVVSKSKGFCMHTDQYTDPDAHTHNGLIGCGHLAKAASPKLSKAYDVNSADVLRVVNYARNVCEISQTMHMVNLAGEHKERGVLIVHSKTHTVLADNPKLNQMYFIYDDERDTAFLSHLVKEMKIRGVTIADMKRESDAQLQATLHNLALGLPIFEISFTGKSPVVTSLGFVHHEQAPKNRLHLSHFPRLFLHRVNHR